jgi:hypothetical protein
LEEEDDDDGNTTKGFRLPFLRCCAAATNLSFSLLFFLLRLFGGFALPLFWNIARIKLPAAAVVAEVAADPIIPVVAPIIGTIPVIVVVVLFLRRRGGTIYLYYITSLLGLLYVLCSAVLVVACCFFTY